LLVLALLLAASALPIAAQTPITLQRADALLPPSGTFPEDAEYKDVQMVPLAPDGRLLLYLPTTRLSGGGSKEALFEWNPVTGVFDNITATGLASFDATKDRGTYDVDFFDADGDGDQDIVHSSPHGSRLMINNGANVFADETESRFPDFLFEDKVNVWDDVVAGDVDADGDLDLFFSNRSKSITGHTRNWGPNVLVYNDGTGFFNSAGINHDEFGEPSTADPAQLEGASHGIKLADMNNDGRLDLLMSHETNFNQAGVNAPGLEVRLNLGDPDGDGRVDWGTGLPDPAGGTKMRNVAVADFNNDGDLDVYFAISGADEVHLGDGDGTFSGTMAVPASAHGNNSYDVVLGDINHDGFMDAATATSDGPVTPRLLMLNNAGASFTMSNETLLNDATVDAFRLTMAFGDVDLDGDLDIIWGGDNRSGNESPVVYRNTTNPADNAGPVVEQPNLFLGANGEAAAVFRVRITDRIVAMDEIDASISWQAELSDSTMLSDTAPLDWAASLSYQTRIACADLRSPTDPTATVTSFEGTVTATDAQGNITNFPITMAHDLATELGATTGTGLSINILEPRSTSPSPVQPTDGTGRMLIRLQFAPLNLVPDTGDFQVSIGGLDASVVSATLVGSEIWLAVVPPSGLALASDLQVTYSPCGVAASDTEVNAVVFGNPQLSDTVLVVDTSGSMQNDRKLESAVNAGTIFANTLRDSDRVGVVEYSGYDGSLGDADQVTPIGLASATRATAIADLGNLSASGSTPIGMGLLEGLSELDSVLAADRNDVRALILLSDGKENVPHFWANPPSWYTPPPINVPVINTFNLAANLAVQIHTVSLGPSANHLLMQNISFGRGEHRQVDVIPSPENAFFYRVQSSGPQLAQNSTSLVGLSLPQRLANQYEHFHNTVSDQQRLWQGVYVTKGSTGDDDPVISERAESGDIALAAWSGQPGRFQFAPAQRSGEQVVVPIEPGLAFATISVNWESATEIGVDIVPPPGQAGTIERTVGPTNTVFRVEQPVAGNWRLFIRAPRLQQLMILASGISGERGIARAFTGRPAILPVANEHVDVPAALAPGSAVPIVLALFGSAPVLNADVRAVSQSPANGSQTFVLRDDGSGSDEQAGDGFYSGLLTETDEGGVFDIQINAFWTGADGLDRERMFPLALTMEERDDDGDTVSNQDELVAGLDPADPQDAGRDPDNDGLASWKELELDIDPFDPDTDDGGADDGLEVCVGTDPSDPADDDNALKDGDGDGLADLWETLHGLDPTDPSDRNDDGDGDGLANTEEFEHCTNPGSRDTDDDNIDDKDEIDQGLDPTDPDNRVDRVDDKPDPCNCPPPVDDDSYPYALSLHLGQTFPGSDLGDVTDGDLLAEVDFEWRFKPRLSLEAVLGRYEFDPAFDVEGLTLYLKGYFPAGAGWRFYAAGGAGLYHPEGDSETGGLSVTAGFNKQLSRRWEFDLGASYFELFSGVGPVDVGFGAAKVGLKYRLR
jgi:hypothetical protein